MKAVAPIDDLRLLRSDSGPTWMRCDNLVIVGFQHACASRLDNDHLALIEGIGAVKIQSLLCLTEFDM
jgi:hypothetical protein